MLGDVKGMDAKKAILMVTIMTLPVTTLSLHFPVRDDPSPCWLHADWRALVDGETPGAPRLDATVLVAAAMRSKAPMVGCTLDPRLWVWGAIRGVLGVAVAVLAGQPAMPYTHHVHADVYVLSKTNIGWVVIGARHAIGEGSGVGVSFSGT